MCVVQSRDLGAVGLTLLRFVAFLACGLSCLWSVCSGHACVCGVNRFYAGFPPKWSVRIGAGWRRMCGAQHGVVAWKCYVLVCV